MKILIGIFLFIFAMVLIAFAIGLKILEDQRKRRVAGMVHGDTRTGTSSSEEPSILVEDPGGQGFTKALRAFGFTSQLETLIRQAGLDLTVGTLAVLSLVAAIVGAFVGSLVPVLIYPSLSSLVFAVVFGMTPYLYVKWKRSVKMSEFELQFPEALDFLARSMRAGHAFSVSLEMLGEESPEPLGQEFRTLFNEQNLGAPIDVALANFAQRVPLLDVRFFVSSVLLQKQTGGNLSEILIRLSYIIRERFRLKGQVKAASAHGRITAAILTAMPMVMIIALLFVAPGYLQGMAHDSDGRWMILGSVLAQVAGYYWMRKIINIKV